jgi:hypothetical protein
MQAQTPAPHPSPELQKLHVFVGHWAGEVEFKPGPWGPGSNAVIEETGQMILGGHFLQIQDTWKGSSQQALWIIGYDPTNQNYSATAYFSGGDTLSGTITCDGNVWSFASKKKISLGGAQYSIRLILTPAADRMSRLDRTEVSPDDKTWLPFDAEKWTKVKTASKK